ncbi:protein PTHB1 [Aethina tumida]|uniref:protein PTHB1 n=1 Tax=Aethina tumida TaxID=116153 RepID=UPI002147AF3C|nr:protein PTHB1 [Aethina tumida]
MSLFKTREFWCTHSEDDEYFDQNSLVVSRLNSESDFVITGSQSGVLRVFKPSSQLTENNNFTGFKPTDLLIEKIINDPILQVGTGRLISGSVNVQVAVLHSRLLSIYTLSTKEGAVEHGTQNLLHLLYEHNLRRSAANFVIGPFGGIQNRDFVCVQSLDGMMSFYEQENYSFSCFLPDFLLPAPFTYVPKTDSFITCSSNWFIESYGYKKLSEVSDRDDDNNDLRTKIAYDWTYNLGESISDIKAIEDNMKKESAIMILGERNLYCLSDKGRLKFMKKLDYSPICFNTYYLEEKVMTLVVSETSTLVIYQNTSVKWSAQLQFLPICIARAFLRTLWGAVVLLSEEGRLECCYLGTDPSLFVAPPLNAKEIDFEQAESELATLNKIIKNAQGNDIKVTNASAERELAINVSVSPHLEPCTYSTNLTTEDQKMCTIKIDILPQALFEEIQISYSVQQPIKVSPQVEFFSNLSERTSINCHCFLADNMEICSLNFTVMASFISSLGVPRTITKVAMLPINLALETCAAQKENEHKITININDSPVPLTVLFPEFMGENSLTQSSNAIGFRNITGEGKIVSILLAKSSERYRLQSDSFASLNLLIELIIYRLKKHFANKSDFHVSYGSALPGNEAVCYLNSHFNVRLRVKQLQNELLHFSSQYRVIQKRLIARFKIKNPTSLTNLQFLLEDTYSDIIKITDELVEETRNLVRSQVELSCALKVIKNLVEIMDIKKELKEQITSLFCENVMDIDSQNWEDVMDGALCYLLRTSLAKSEKDKLRAAHSSFEEVKDVSKVEKHLTQVLERIQKKGVLLKPDEDELESNDEDEERTVEEKALVPIGSQFGESSTRLLSARKSLLKRRQNLQEPKLDVES